MTSHKFQQSIDRMSLKHIALSLTLSGLFTLVSCSTVETIPQVTVRPNNSGIEIGEVKQQGPSFLLGQGWVNGEPSPPDVPPRTTIEVKRSQTLRNKGPRYFIAASGLVQVVSIERYSDYGDPNTLTKWEKIINSPEVLRDLEQNKLNSAQISEIPYMNAARVFHGKLRKRQFPWGNAVLFLTSYIQGNTGGPVNNDMLILVVQGLTSDGRYAVNARLEISHPKLPNSSWDYHFKGKAVFSIDDECDEAEEWLDSQPDHSFSPTIGDYETFLSSLDISLGRPATELDTTTVGNQLLEQG